VPVATRAPQAPIESVSRARYTPHQCRVPCLRLCIRISISMHSRAIENSPASAATNSEAVSNESTISSPQALFPGFLREADLNHIAVLFLADAGE
jgi:hypothetical protein